MYSAYNREREIRRPVSLNGVMFSRGRTATAAVTNLSSGGARLFGDQLPSVGTEVLLIIGAQRAYSRVAWRDDDACGISFDDMLLDGQLVQFCGEHC